ncbi:MAG: SMP-30/gluconolactonase/LRE family protein, partial [Verrucomicrobiota bacterium]
MNIEADNLAAFSSVCFSMTRTLRTTLILFSLLGLYASAESPIKPGSELTLISHAFELADGPAWNGWSLTVPDPLGQETKRWIPAKDEWSPQYKGKRFSASFFNHGHHYFSDNGNGAILKRDYLTKELEVLHQEDLEADKTRKPNDLVVDRSGGIYFTLTRAGQVIYVSPDGESSVAAEGVETANGIILSPD